MAAESREGLLTSDGGQGQGSWAWAGARLSPGPGDATSEETAAWLGTLASPQGHTCVEIRYANDPASHRLSCALLGRVWAAEPEQAGPAALALREAMLRLPPGRLRAAPILDPAELHARLAQPFDAAAAELFEVRKRLTVQRLTGPYRTREAAVVVHPLRRPPDGSREAFLAALAGLPERAVAGLCLEPVRVPHEQLAWLRHVAQEYVRQAGGAGRGPAHPYEFRGGGTAVTAAAGRVFAEAAERYAGAAWRWRMWAAAERPSPGLAAAVAALAAALDAAAVPVPGPGSVAAWQAVVSLGSDWPGRPDPPTRPQTALEPADRLLADLADAAEAGALLSLPRQPAHAPPLFADTPEAADAAGAEAPMVAVLTALGLEYRAVVERLTDREERVHPGGLVVEVGRLPGSRRRVAVALTEEGNQNAALITQLVISWLRPECVLFVGVAGALRGDIAVGDVVVATKILSYGGGKESAEGFLARPEAWEAPFRLRRHARRVLEGDTRWTRRIGADPAVPAVHFKPIAAGGVVVAAGPEAPVATLLRQHYNDAVAVEMEGAGVAQAAHLAGSHDVLVVRGISDHADPGKGAEDAKGGQPLAAAHAAAAALEIIDRLPLRPG